MSRSEGGDVRPAGRFPEMGRKEWLRKGGDAAPDASADVFCQRESPLPYGDIGIKVWTYKGEKI